MKKKLITLTATALAVGFSGAQSGTVDKTNIAAANLTNWFLMSPFKRDTNKINLTISNIAIKPQSTNGFGVPMDFAATNIQILCSHEPLIVGKTNGEWCIRFK